MRGDTDLKDKEDEDNNISVDENVTEEGGDEHDLTDVEETVDCSSHEVLPTLGGAALCCVALCWELRHPPPLSSLVRSQPGLGDGVSSNLS